MGLGKEPPGGRPHLRLGLQPASAAPGYLSKHYHWLAQRQRGTILDLHPACQGPSASGVEGPAHGLIQGRRNDAPMGEAWKAQVHLPRREVADGLTAFDAEGDPEALGILLAAAEAPAAGPFGGLRAGAFGIRRRRTRLWRGLRAGASGPFFHP